MSSVRSRSAGSATCTTARRKNRSARKRPALTSVRRLRLVAATTRTSTFSGFLPPMRRTSRLSSARKSLGWSSSDSSPTSSRNSVPPSASSKAPARAPLAPVNAPASWPNRWASMRPVGIELQSTTTNAPSLRALSRCTASAAPSLPVPVSPSSNTVASLTATWRSCANSARVAAA